MDNWNNGYDDNQNSNSSYNEQEYAFQTLMRNGRPKTVAWSVASLIAGIVSVVCCSLGWTGIILGVLGVVFAILSRRMLGYFDGMSIAGLILGIFGFVFGVALIVAMNSLPPELWEEVKKFWEEYMKQFEDIYGNGGDGNGNGGVGGDV
jgi:1,4-dihydroxy-2-naphthoate octaprenyltransferase